MNPTDEQLAEALLEAFEVLLREWLSDWNDMVREVNAMAAEVDLAELDDPALRAEMRERLERRLVPLRHDLWRLSDLIGDLEGGERDAKGD